MSKEEASVSGTAPGIIVRHTNRRLGALTTYEASERLISGHISFSEFVDQVGESYSELLDFMTEHDLHPGRPEDVLYCIDFYASGCDRATLQTQLGSLYNQQSQVAG